jgi:pyruvate/2-oxoglutarate dehydrogenase complex dihydrolipoamide acyltransferase (E2) component
LPEVKIIFSDTSVEWSGGVVMAWVHEEKDWVAKDEKLADLKLSNGSTADLCSPARGVLEKIIIPAGAAFNPGDVLGIIRTVRGGT